MRYKIDTFPVYYGWGSALEAPSDYRPKDFPMEVFFDKCGLLIQDLSEDLKQTLADLYKIDKNIGYLQEGHELCDLYGNDFIAYVESEIIRVFGEKKVQILEIGSGGGYLAKRLVRLGHRVTTIDPSPLAARVAQSVGAIHLSDSFPSRLCEKYHVVVNMDVWEHTYDPYDFLRSVSKVLMDGGRHITSIPDCERSINIGDHGIFMHQHVSYFSPQSVRRVANEAHNSVDKLVRSNVGGSLYATLSSDFIEDSSLTLNDQGFYAGSIESQAKILNNFHNSNRKFINFVERSLSQNKTLGIWNPLRAIPFLAGSDLFGKVRFFDHDSKLRNQKPTGSSFALESVEDLLSCPTDLIIIMSLTWGSQIRTRLINEGYRGKIHTLTEILTEEH